MYVLFLKLRSYLSIYIYPVFLLYFQLHVFISVMTVYACLTTKCVTGRRSATTSRMSGIVPLYIRALVLLSVSYLVTFNICSLLTFLQSS